MKKLLSFLLLSFSVVTVSEAKLTAYLSFGTFDNPTGNPYIETYLKIIGNTSKAIKTEKGTIQSKIEVKWIFKNGDKIVHFEKYNLLSPELTSKDTLIPDFINQQRISLESGKYSVELYLKDINSNDPEIRMEQNVELKFNKDTVQISDIELLESYSPSTETSIFTKNGYHLTPFPDNFYPEEIKKIRFYAEVYNTLSTNNDPFLIRYYLSNDNNNQLLEDMVISRKEKAQAVNPILGEFPLENLPSGNWNVNIEVVNKYNKLLAYKKIFFQRSNTVRKPIVSTDYENLNITNTFVSNITNPDTLVYLIDVLYPISSASEINVEENQMVIHDVKSMQKFLYYFWGKRNNADPQTAWTNYMIEVTKVNRSFGALNRRGYETDRGRVYLQYGAPSTMTEYKDDPEAFPYEIWHFLTLGNQTNKKFIFYCREMVTQNYKLLHSDAKGEIFNSHWELDLHSRGQQYGPDLDIEKADDIYGSKTKENFNNPR